MRFWIFLAASLGLALHAAEPPIKEGLVLALNAAQLSGNGRAVDRWSSARQILASSRPVLRSSDGEAFLRFDGKDDFFTVNGPARSTTDATIFVLASVRSNPGFFSGLFATAPSGVNDYVGGLNLDFGPASTTNLSVVNIESAGSSGFADLFERGFILTGQLPFGGFHLFTVRTKAGPKGTEFFMDGLLSGTRARAESKIGLDDMVIGGRLYSNDPTQSPFAQGFLNGDIAAVLVYDRALNDADREKVEQSLFSRVAKLNAIASGQQGHALEAIANPPALQMLAPGFTVHELPIKLSNINNLRYRHDGKLVALGYDGRIHLLTDTDNDGLEDKAASFWDKPTLRSPIGIALLPADDARGDGVFVASKRKISLILDRDRDGRADEEMIVAEGWKEITHNVDALGLAVDPKDGSIYFSIACENFVDAYLRDPNGNSHYSLTSERGTVQRVSKDFSKRETVATGVRFLCALAFNREGELFATDQEGATWLPNGNPLDELLHIQPGRHYGFPPRHPKHLPNVIDEPAIMEYGPQHQSTVGMIFNDGVNGGPSFGPAHWDGDAIICGESRGKIYRTKLAKTAEGYLAQNTLIAGLSLLTVDACISPQGDLVVACHSGPPDWGTGPAGEGKLFKVRYARKDVPQVTAAWASAPDEFRIAFDRSMEVSDWTGAREKIRIEAGQHVAAGDRFESIRPGYQIVRDQMSAPRRWVDLQTLSLSSDRRNLILRIARQTEAINYAVTLPTPKSWLASVGLEQRPEIDVAITMNGVQSGAVVANAVTRVVLPHPSLKASKAFTAGSTDHEAFFQRLDKPAAKLELRAHIDNSNIFVPATQPGASLDWNIAADKFANRRMRIVEDYSGPSAHEVTGGEKGFSVEFPAPINANGSGLFFALDADKRPIQLSRLTVPWSTTGPTKTPTNLVARTDVKGNWLHGRRLFFGAATCSTCHTIRGEGSEFGPDLSNLVFRDRDSVINDITLPSSTINPDHTGSLIKFKDGSELNGLVRTADDQEVVIRLPAGLEQKHPRSAIASIELMKTSLMPEGIGAALSKTQMEDLLTFMLTNPIEPTPITRLDPPTPPARKRAEFASLLGTNSAPQNPKPLRILLCGGPKDHGIDEHDYPLWLERWSKLFALAEKVQVATNMGFPSREQLAKADVAVFFSANPGWNADSAKLIDEFQKNGGGLVYLHYGIEGGKDHLALAERIGLSFYASAFRHGEMDLIFPDPNHPITKGFPTTRFTDESYWALKGDPKRIHNLADSVEDKQPRPQVWTLEREKGRVFVCIPGHYMWTFDDPLYRILVFRGLAWSAHETDLNRFNELVTLGARVAP